MYSQSPRSNAGTRGLDEIGRETYVRTLLDERLRAALLAGEFRLVAVTGNAGDGKTAYIQQIERAKELAPTLVKRPNGSEFSWSGRRFITNHDGSQDEDGRANDEVLREFFRPFEGDDGSGWPDDETRIIAVNEGRLVDFLTEHESRYRRLRAVILAGLGGGAPEDGVVTVNLAWQGGEGSGDRLLTLLRQIDVGEATNPDLDRTLDYLPPDAGEMAARFAFDRRGDYDTRLLERLYRELPRDASAPAPEHMAEHRDYVAMLRRRQFFERRDEHWKEMLPYRTYGEFWNLVAGRAAPGARRPASAAKSCSWGSAGARGSATPGASGTRWPCACASSIAARYGATGCFPGNTSASCSRRRRITPSSSTCRRRCGWCTHPPAASRSSSSWTSTSTRCCRDSMTATGRAWRSCRAIT